MPEAAPAPVAQPAIPAKPNGVAPKVEAPKIDPKAPVAEANPLADREKIVAQKDAAAAKRFREAADLQKKAESLLAEFERDPIAAVSKAGKDGTKFLKDWLDKQKALEGMTPEQREAAQLKAELADRDARLKAVDDEKAKAKDDALVQQTEKWLENEFLSAAKRLEAPGTPEMLEMMATVGLEFGEIDITPRTPGYADMVVKEAMSRVESNRSSIREREIATAVKAGDVSALKAILGPEGVALLLKDSVTQIPSAGKPRATPNEPVKRETKGHISPADFEKRWGRR